MPEYFTFTRRWSLFAPDFTYGVDTVTHNGRIGEVARNKNDRRVWWASNKTWTGGGDLNRTFTTRYAAATALDWIAGGGDPDDVGGYAHDTEVKLADDGVSDVARCATCGWSGPTRQDWKVAKADETEHRAAAAAEALKRADFHWEHVPEPKEA